VAKQRTNDSGRATVERRGASVSEVTGSSDVRAMSRRTECIRTNLFVVSDT